MAITVNFWSTFSKRKNSTAQPPAQADQSFSCVLKSDSGILNPVLEIGLPMISSPAALTYAQIPSYNRYYWVTDWQWSGGLWLCSLAVDPLASYKAVIGASSRYILRAAADYNADIVDSFYPPESHVTVTIEPHSFGWHNNFTNGRFVLGIVSGKGGLLGSTDYYILSPADMRALMSYLYPLSSGSWTNYVDVSSIIDRAVYNPSDYIVSCKYFPLALGGIEQDELLAFGNFETNVAVEPLSKPDQWPTYQHDYSLPSDWLSRDARERCSPYCSIYYWLNPWGVIDLSPEDFTLTDTVRVRIIPDLISGEGAIQIYALVNSIEILVAQQTAMIGYDIPLQGDTRDFGSMVAALIGGASTVTAEITAGMPPASIISTAGAVYADVARPSIEASSSGTPAIVNLTGASRLYTRRHTFPDQNISEFGRPLYDNRTISTLPGYIKCGDGDIQIAGFDEERTAISEYLTGGFYYE